MLCLQACSACCLLEFKAALQLATVTFGCAAETCKLYVSSKEWTVALVSLQRVEFDGLPKVRRPSSC